MVDEHDEQQFLMPLSVDEFRERLTALEGEAAVDPTIFSDLDRAKLAVLRRSWFRLPTAVRQQLVTAMNELSEEQIAVNFSRALKIALHDQDPQVRAAAIAGLWEDDSEELLTYLLNDAIRDDDLAVRQAAVQALARFSQLDAEEALDPRWHTPLRGALLDLVQGDDPLEIRRRALEAVAVYAGDPTITAAIDKAYQAEDELLGVSALYAMGRNLDERWLPIIITELGSPLPAMRYEATKASGEYGDRRALPQLTELLGDADREVQLAAIGAIGRIGGNSSLTILKRLAGSDDEAIREAAEEAIDEASFVSNPIGIGGRFDPGEN